MLDFHNTRKAVFSPGTDSIYFDGLTLAATPLQLTQRFVQTNAWWLAELSRVINQQAPNQILWGGVWQKQMSSDVPFHNSQPT